MTRVTSAVFQKELGRCESDQQAFYPHELPDEVIERLGTAVRIPEEAYQFDHEYPAVEPGRY